MDMKSLIEALEQLGADWSALERLAPEERERLQRAVARLHEPDRVARRQRLKAERRAQLSVYKGKSFFRFLGKFSWLPLLAFYGRVYKIYQIFKGDFFLFHFDLKTMRAFLQNIYLRSLSDFRYCPH